MNIKIIKILALLMLAASITACGNNQSTQRKSSSLEDLKSASDTNVELAIGYIKRQQYEVAKNKLEKAIKQNPENLNAYKTMAYLMNALGKVDEAEDYYQDAFEIKGDDPELHNSYGAFLCSHNRLDEAYDEFRKAFENPYYKSAHLAYSNAGNCLLKQKKYKMAEEHLRIALRAQPTMPNALLSMAEVGLESRKYLMARAYIQRFHAASKPTAESLWVQAQAEKALGAQDYYLQAAKQLLKEFPDSEEAGRLDQSVYHERYR